MPGTWNWQKRNALLDKLVEKEKDPQDKAVLQDCLHNLNHTNASFLRFLNDPDDKKPGYRTKHAKKMTDREKDNLRSR